MGKINILDKKIAELIAAGEIIERPSSVVKELVENSIDAGSKKITVKIKFGGIKFIKVIDDGCGILHDDIKKAFLPHATSKIRTENDLEKINTLGFRGEALASIAAVARVRLKTLSNEEKVGSCYEINFSENNILTECGHPFGTEFEVCDLFYNLPARMKFLKSNVKEGQNVGILLEKLALSHPEISFRFQRDDKDIFVTPGDGALKSSVFALFGKEFFDGLIPVKYDYEYVKISGYVGKPEAAKLSRSSQYFFINGRYVKLKVGGIALDEAYREEILRGKFPSAILHINISAEAFDANVHPSKIEVKFFDEKIIFNTIFYAAKTALNKYKSDTFPLSTVKNLQKYQVQSNTFSVDNDAKSQNSSDSAKIELRCNDIGMISSQTTPTIMTHGGYQTHQTIAANSSNNSLSDNEIHFQKVDENDDENLKSKNLSLIGENENPPKISLKNIKIIGEIFDTYIVVQLEKKVVLIDKHAAHERLIFEQLESSKEFKVPDSQILAKPVIVNLNSNEYFAILEKKSDIEKAGFVIEDFGQNMILVRSAPVYIEYERIPQEICEIASYIVENKQNLKTNFVTWLQKNVACRNAIKSGDISNNIEIVSLVQRLFRNPNVIHCPHGRPIYVTWDENFFKKQFLRR